jgi:hypothetical protein
LLKNDLSRNPVLTLDNVRGRFFQIMLQVFARPRVVGGGNLSYPEPLSRTQLWPSAGRSAAAETEIVFDDNTRSECSLIGCRVADAVRAHELSADAIGLGCGV